MKLFRSRDEKEAAQLDSPIVALSAAELREQIIDIVDSLPWLGTAPFELSLSRKLHRNLPVSAGFKRRILVSWLIGRPVSEIARMAGCSTRTAYNVVRHLFYDLSLPRPMAEWAALGLIAVVDGPAVEFVPTGRRRMLPRSDEEFPVFCLVCHRIVAQVEALPELRLHDGSIVMPGDERWTGSFDWSAAVHGHLLCHFGLGDDPIRFKPKRHRELMAMLLGKPPEDLDRAMRQDMKDPRSHWTEHVEEETERIYRDWLRQGAHQLLPVRGERQMRPEQAERFWQSVLKGREQAI